MGSAKENAKNIMRVLIDRDGYADLYRTITAGPSGQRSDLLVGRIRYVWKDPFEVEIIDMTSQYDRGYRAGYACREHGRGWAIFNDDEFDGVRFKGYADTLSLGVDVLINGVHAATGRHDSRRISAGKWEPFVPAEV